jgi:uncharacterized membrane protein (UPF0182 family)
MTDHEGMTAAVSIAVVIMFVLAVITIVVLGWLDELDRRRKAAQYHREVARLQNENNKELK